MVESYNFVDFYKLKSYIKFEVEQKLSTHLLKILVVDDPLLKPLSQVLGYSELKSLANLHRLYSTDMMEKQLYDCREIVFLIRPDNDKIVRVCQHINTLQNKESNNSSKYTILCMPRKTHLCISILEEEGLFGKVNLGDFSMDCIPLDEDLVSLEIPDSFSSLFLEKTPKYVFDVAQSLHSLAACFGDFTNFHCIGTNACKAYTLFRTLSLEKVCNSETQIGSIIIMDRNIDLISPLLTSEIYPSLLSEVFDIKFGQISLDGKDTIKLDKSDICYKKHLCDLKYHQVRKKIADLLSIIKDKSERGKNIKEVDEFGQFVKGDLKEIVNTKSLLSNHLTACEKIKALKFDPLISNIVSMQNLEEQMLQNIGIKEVINTIEEYITQQENPEHSLRLLSLLSLTQNGLDEGKLEELFKIFLHANGYNNLDWLNNLKKCNLVLEKKQSNNLFMKNLVTKNIGKLDNLETKPSFVFNGTFTPLICYLIDKLIINASKENKVNIQMVEDFKKLLNTDVSFFVNAESARQNPRRLMVKKTVLVFIIGGLSRSEMSAVRSMSYNSNYKFLFGTTEMINSLSLIKSVR